jgi:phosphatidylglycerol:prolipoprotein diacylglycerol transferase
VAEPLIPFIKLPEIPLSFLEHIPLLDRLVDPAHPPSIKPFGTLVALGVYIGSVVAVRHARERNLDEKKMNEFIFWVVAAGFVGGHVLDAVFYHPGRVARDPLYLLRLWDGLSSFGGFIGALSGAIAWRISRAQPILPFCEVVNSAFPLAWVFGRAGCASVHDHPGRLSEAWFAVRWPQGSGFVGRYDLGLYECLLTIPLAVAFAILWRRKTDRPLGFYTGIMCVAYAPVRFALDFLRENEGSITGGDPRYGGLTPAQWACLGLLALGLYFLRMAARGGPGSGAAAPAAPTAPTAPEPEPVDSPRASA